MTDDKFPKSDSSQFQAWEGSSVFVQQGRHWSSTFIWLTVGLFTSGLIFAFTAKIDQTVSVRGQLTPSGSVHDIDSPSSGVVLEVLVKEGQQVDIGDPLLTIRADGLLSRADSFKTRLLLIRSELDSLKSIINFNGIPGSKPPFPPLLSSDIPLIQEKILAARNQSIQIWSQLRQLSIRLASRKESLALQTSIAEDLKPLYESGGLARNNYLSQLNSLQELSANISALESEKIRLIGSATARLNDLNRQYISLKSQLSIVLEEISFRTVNAPAAGIIFNLSTSPQSFVSSSQELLSIVPRDLLKADVAIPNMDIGFVKVGQAVSVAVDSFPSGEFGYIDGHLTSIGSDSLPPDSDSPQVYFPATISLSQQKVQSGTSYLNLQSGMSVTANIKLRSRSAITLITDIFTRQLDGVKRFR